MAALGNRAAHGIGGLLGHDGRPPADLYGEGRRELAQYLSVQVVDGLVNEVVEDDALESRVLELAQTLAALPPLAVSATKRLVWNGIGAGVEERLGEEARVVSELSGTEDSREGLAAVIERRAPKFVGR